MSAPASIGLLQAQVAEILRKSREARAIGFHVGTPWSGPASLEVEGKVLPIFYCPSPLAFRARLVEHEDSAAPVVLLTDRNDQELGLDVVARLAKHRLLPLNYWQALLDRFGVRAVDPRLRELRWLPAQLLALGEDESFRPATQVLDADEVWQLLLSRLGLPEARPDLRTLLEWTAGTEGPGAFLALPAEVRADYTRRIAESAGEAARAVLHLVAARRGEEAVAAGLVCELLFPTGPAADAEAARAAGRFEASLLGGETLSAQEGRAWAEAASGLVERRLAAGGEGAVQAWLSQAERLLTELKAQPLGERSAWLPSAFGARVRRFAELAAAWLDQPGTSGLAELAEAAESVRRHRLKTARAAEVEAIEGLLRLGRFLAAGKDRKPAGSFPAAAAGYAREGSFVDRLRTGLAAASLSDPLRPVRDRLLEAVSELREAENRRFAELLAQWSETPTDALPLIPVESVLDRVVAPLAAAGPVLLLVLDGLSFGVFRELAEDLPGQGWEEVWSEEAREALHGVGLLPTVTEVCRTSLLCGDRKRGNAAEESRGFAAHPGLRRHGSLNLPPVLFHKEELEKETDRVLAEVERPAQRVVGAVLNAVDDQLPKGGQLVKRWQVSALLHLSDLLQAAAAAGRTVVITADHGHLVERTTELRRHEGGKARWRPAAPPPGEGEIAARGPRVLLDEGAGLVLAWSERLRYANLQSGYHGGASPQEVMVPLAVWVPFGSGIAGWQPAGRTLPDWWSAEEAAAAETPPAAKPRPRAKAAAVPEAQGQLFRRDAWLADLFASPVYREQLGRAGRQSLGDDKVEEVLKKLEAGGGRLTLPALAHQLGVSPPRAQGLVAALQRVLNVEGFAVLALDPASETVTLDRGLLAKQFPAGEERA